MGTETPPSLPVTAEADVGPADALEQLSALNRKLGDTVVDPTMWPQIIDSLPDGLIVIDEAGLVLLVNVATELLFGYHRSRLVGESVHMLLAPSLRAMHDGHLASFFENPSMRPMALARHLPALHASGRTIMVQISIGPLISEAGVFGLAIVRRVTPAPAGGHGAG